MEPAKRKLIFETTPEIKRTRTEKTKLRLIESIDLELQYSFAEIIRGLTSAFQHRPKKDVTKAIFVFLKRNFNKKLQVVDRFALRKLSQRLRPTHPHTANLVKSFCEKDSHLYFKKLPLDIWKLIFIYLDKDDYEAVRELHQDRLEAFCVNWHNEKQFYTVKEQFLKKNIHLLKKVSLLPQSQTYIERLTDWGVEELRLCCSELKVPEVLSKVNPASLRKLMFIQTQPVAIDQAIDRLQHVDELWLRNVNASAVEDKDQLFGIINQMSNLGKISFFGCKLTLLPDSLPLKLRELDLSHNHLMDISWVERLTNLTSLVYHNTIITQPDVRAVNTLTSLKRLTLSPSSSSVSINLENLFQLTRLDLNYCQMKGWRDVEQITTILRNNVRLKDLRMRHTVVITKILNVVAGLSFLEELDISQNKFEEGDPFRPLSALTRLRVLRVEETLSRKVSWAFLQALTNLNRLDAESNKLSDSDLEHVSQLPSLTYLSISHNTIGTGVNYLTGLTRLHQLWMESCGVCESSVLSKLTTLSLLNVTSNKLSFTDISQLIQMPRMRMLWFEGNSVKDAEKMKTLEDSKTAALNKRWGWNR